MAKNNYNGIFKLNELYLFDAGSELYKIKITGLYNLSNNSNPLFNVVKFKPLDFKCPELDEFEDTFIKHIQKI